MLCIEWTLLQKFYIVSSFRFYSSLLSEGKGRQKQFIGLLLRTLSTTKFWDADTPCYFETSLYMHVSFRFYLNILSFYTLTKKQIRVLFDEIE